MKSSFFLFSAALMLSHAAFAETYSAQRSGLFSTNAGQVKVTWKSGTPSLTTNFEVSGLTSCQTTVGAYTGSSASGKVHYFRLNKGTCGAKIAGNQVRLYTGETLFGAKVNLLEVNLTKTRRSGPRVFRGKTTRWSLSEI